ncbi:hypothetical protein JCM10207_007522 [Rhodosporidiobolus poonsookiae]
MADNSDKGLAQAVQPDEEAVPAPLKVQPSTAGLAVEAGPSKTMMARMAGPSDLKAGVGGVNTAEQVQKIIYEASKGSKYFNDQQRRDKELEAKTDRLKRLLAEKELTARGDEEEIVDRILEQLEEKRDMSRVIALIDADAFYAACHAREDPSLVGKAYGVGGGMLTTASYEARKYGCRSAMPLYLAKKLCPHLISLKLKPELYTKASREIMTILAKYGQIAPASLDEAYVDLTQYCADEGVTPSEAISRLRAEVRETTGLTVSAGVSPNKALSKIAADINKPDGQFVVDFTPQACMEFIKGVRLRRCYGIGRVTEVLLNSVGFEKVEDLFIHRKKLYLMRDHLGNKDTFRWLLGLYLGLGSNRVVRAKRGDRKTYGVEKTFTPTDDEDTLKEILRKIAKALAKDLAKAEFSGRTITLKIKHDTFQAVTRAFTPGKNQWIMSYKDIFELGLRLLRKEQDDRHAALARGDAVKGGKNVLLRPRLLGLRVSNLRDEREVKKEAKLDGFFTRAASPAKKKPVDGDLSLLSDSDDTDVERSDAESDLDGDENPEQRQLAQLKLEATSLDPFGAMDDMGAAGGGETSGRWMCVDEELTIAEGGSSKAPPMSRTSSSSSSAASGSTSRGQKRAFSPHADRLRWTSAYSTQFLEGEDEAAQDGQKGKKQKKKRAAEEDDDDDEVIVVEEPRQSSFTCPVCAKEFKGSEAAMTGHVEKCLSGFDKPKKKKSSASSLVFGSGKPLKGKKERDKVGGKKR